MRGEGSGERWGDQGEFGVGLGEGGGEWGRWGDQSEVGVGLGEGRGGGVGRE